MQPARVDMRLAALAPRWCGRGISRRIFRSRCTAPCAPLGRGAAHFSAPGTSQRMAPRRLLGKGKVHHAGGQAESPARGAAACTSPRSMPSSRPARRTSRAARRRPDTARAAGQGPSCGTRPGPHHRSLCPPRMSPSAYGVPEAGPSPSMADNAVSHHHVRPRRPHKGLPSMLPKSLRGRESACGIPPSERPGTVPNRFFTAHVMPTITCVFTFGNVNDKTARPAQARSASNERTRSPCVLRTPALQPR